MSQFPDWRACFRTAGLTWDLSPVEVDLHGSLQVRYATLSAVGLWRDSWTRWNERSARMYETSMV